MKTNSFRRWCATLRHGDLVGATNPRGRLGHILVYKGHKTARNSRDGNDDPTLVQGTALCGTTGSGWFWSPLQHGDPTVFEEGEDCQRCHREWKRAGATLRVFVRERADGVGDDEDLPFGWKADSLLQARRESTWNYDKDRIIFEETRAWKRGARRILIGNVVEAKGEDQYPLLVAHQWVGESKVKTYYMCTTLEQALLHAYEKMAQGGY